MRKSFKAPKLVPHKEKFLTGLGYDFQSDFLSVSCKAPKETSPFTKQIMRTNTCKLPLSFPKEAVQRHGYHR